LADRVAQRAFPAFSIAAFSMRATGATEGGVASHPELTACVFHPATDFA
jgi:hypothetical protein